MVVGILAKASDAETMLNNLSEADYDLSDVSLVMQDTKTRNAVHRDTGPLKGVKPQDLDRKLSQFGMNGSQAKSYKQAVLQGQVFVAIACPPAVESGAVEILNDYHPTMVKTLPVQVFAQKKK